MKLRFTPRALETLLSFLSISVQSILPVPAMFEPRFMRAFQSLILFPRLDRLQKAEGVRKIIPGNTHTYLLHD